MKSFDFYSTKRISFILATKNRARFLEKALDSHRNLIGPKDEFIIVDGGSNDDTLDVLMKNSDIVTTFISEKDISEGHACNKAALLASGKYIKLLTDDDIFYKSAIKKACKIMDKNPEIDVLLCGGIKDFKGQISYAYAPRGAHYGRHVGDIFRWGGCGLGMLIRRKSLAVIGLFNPRALALDNDFLAGAIARGANVRFCRLKMFYHYLQEHSAIIARPVEMARDFERIRKEHGLRDVGFIMNLRIKLSQILFPLFPKAIQDFYFKNAHYFKKGEKTLKFKPIWDGGFS